MNKEQTATVAMADEVPQVTPPEVDGQRAGYTRYSAADWNAAKLGSRPRNKAEGLTLELLNSFQAELEMNRPSRAEIVFPSGGFIKRGVLYRHGLITDLTVQDYEELANTEESFFNRVEGVMQRRLAKLWCDDPTVPPISKQADIIAALQKMGMVDRVFLIYQLRLKFIALNYPFTDVCPHCEEPGVYGVDLSTVEFRGISNPLERRFETTLKSGTKLQWHLFDGISEALLAANPRKDKEPTAARGFAVRIEKIIPVDGEVIDFQTLTFQERVQHSRDLPARDGQEFLTLHISKEGEVDTDLRVECKNEKCMKEFKSIVWAQTTNFFYPGSVLPALRANFFSASIPSDSNPTSPA